MSDNIFNFQICVLHKLQNLSNVSKHEILRLLDMYRLSWLSTHTSIQTVVQETEKVVEEQILPFLAQVQSNPTWSHSQTLPSWNFQERTSHSCCCPDSSGWYKSPMENSCLSVGLSHKYWVAMVVYCHPWVGALPPVSVSAKDSADVNKWVFHFTTKRRLRTMTAL